MDIYKKSLTVSALVAAGAFPAVSSAEVSANIGWVSEYIFRGIYQEDSSASAGIDYESDTGFYLGTWGADVGDGLETDLYFGYGGGSGDFSYSVGYTGYFYTDDFDDTYNEVNLGVGYGIFALDVALGEWDGFGASEDYTFTSFTIAPDVGPYYTFGSWGEDFDGDYFELGYGFDFQGLDLSMALIYSDDLPVADADDGEFGDYSLVFGVTRGIAMGASIE